MHQPSADKPAQSQIVFPLLEVLQELGGAGSPTVVSDELARRFELPEDVTAAVSRSRDGQVINLWRRHVRFAREKAKAMGYIASERRGEWSLTPAGKRGIQHAKPTILVEVLTTPEGQFKAARLNMCIGLPTTHLLAQGDARKLDFIENDSVDCIITSIPYFDIKRYESAPGQLAEITSYDAFVEAMEAVLRECQRVLIPGGKMAINVGDVLRARATHGEHHVLPLHAHVLTRATSIGLRALTGILWQKQTNVSYEQNGNGVLGKPGQPNGIIKAELEHVLLLKKQGPYRSTTREQQRDSAITKEEYAKWFRPIWSDISGASTKNGHPAPFPIELAYRLCRMFSFVNDTILDPFGGSGTTALAAAKAGRNSICVDIAAGYVRQSVQRLRRGDIEIVAA